MSKVYLTVALMLASAIPAAALDLNLPAAGTLDRYRDQLENTLDSKVTLQGVMDVRDMSLLSRVSTHVRTLDLSGVNAIAPYEYSAGSYKGRKTFQEGEIVPGMLTGTNVQEVVLPSCAVSIGDNAFAYSSLTSIVIPESVVNIGDYAFAGSGRLSSVKVQGNTQYGKGVFADCVSLATFSAVGGLATVTDGMFRNCRSLASMPAGVTAIGADAFHGSGLKSLNLSGVTSVGDYAFAEMPDLTQVYMNGYVRFGRGVFFGNAGLESITDWSGNLPEVAVAHSGVTMPLTVNSSVVSEAAFANTPNISRVNIGKEVREIHAYAFRNDWGIREVNVDKLGSVIPVLDSKAFDGLEDAFGKYPVTLLVLFGTEDKWRAAPVWQNFNIVGSSGISDIEEDDANLTVVRNGRDLTVSSTEPLGSVAIYSVSGLNYFTGGQGDYEVTAQVPDSELVVVKVVTARHTVKVFKLR